MGRKVIAPRYPVEAGVIRAVEAVDRRGRPGVQVIAVVLIGLRTRVGEGHLEPDGGDLRRVALVVERVFLGDPQAVRLRALADDGVALAADRIRQPGVFTGLRADRPDGDLRGVVELDVLAVLRQVLRPERNGLGDAAAQIRKAQVDLRRAHRHDLLRSGLDRWRHGSGRLLVHDHLAFAGRGWRQHARRRGNAGRRRRSRDGEVLGREIELPDHEADNTESNGSPGLFIHEAFARRGGEAPILSLKSALCQERLP